MACWRAGSATVTHTLLISQLLETAVAPTAQVSGTTGSFSHRAQNEDSPTTAVVLAAAAGLTGLQGRETSPSHWAVAVQNAGIDRCWDMPCSCRMEAQMRLLQVLQVVSLYWQVLQP